MPSGELPWLALGLIVFSAIFIPLRRALLKPKRKPSGKPQKDDLYQDLRNQILTTHRASLGLEPGTSSTDPWGVLMDWHIANGMVTVVSIIDGTASVYTSSGGGTIGGQSSEPIRQAAKFAVKAAAEVMPQARAVTDFPLPPGDLVSFYIMTDSGVFVASDREESLRDGTSSLAKLGNAMQQIISLY